MPNMTPDKRERKNITIFLMFTVALGIAGNICSGGYTTTYLIKLGFDIEGIRNCGIIEQTVSIFAYLIFTRLPAVKKGLKNIYAATVLLAGMSPVVYIAAAYIPSFTVIYIIILSLTALNTILGSFKTVAEFSMLPHLFPRSLYGTVTGKAMVAGGVISIGISVGVDFLLKNDASSGYTFRFAVSALISAVSAFLVLLYKLDGGGNDTPPPCIAYSDIIKKIVSARYIKIMLPHFLRGVAVAGIYYIIPVSLENINLSNNEKSYLIIISVVSTITGSFLFMRLNNKIKSGMITFVSIFACSVIMPLVVICINKYIFFILLFVFGIFNIVSSTSIPNGVLRSTTDDELPVITSIRFVLMSVVSALFIFIFGILLKYIAPVYIMLFSGIIFIICGFLYKKQFDDRFL